VLKLMAGVWEKYAFNTRKSVHFSAMMQRVCALVESMCAVLAESLLFFITCLSVLNWDLRTFAMPGAYGVAWL
jgi:hypothetical protein